MATLADVAQMCEDDSERTGPPQPFYDRLSDSFIFLAKDVRTYANVLNRRFTLFLDAADNSLVGLEIKGFAQLVKEMRKFDLTVTNSTVNLRTVAFAALQPDDRSLQSPNSRDQTIESIRVLLRDANLCESEFDRQLFETIGT
jgi:hypothetical protein